MAWYLVLHRYRQAEPLLVTATVPRDRVLAVKLGRNEAEVVTFDARRVAVEPARGGLMAFNFRELEVTTTPEPAFRDQDQASYRSVA